MVRPVSAGLGLGHPVPGPEQPPQSALARGRPNLQVYLRARRLGH